MYCGWRVQILPEITACSFLCSLKFILHYSTFNKTEVNFLLVLNEIKSTYTSCKTPGKTTNIFDGSAANSGYLLRAYVRALYVNQNLLYRGPIIIGKKINLYFYHVILCIHSTGRGRKNIKTALILQLLITTRLCSKCHCKTTLYLCSTPYINLQWRPCPSNILNKAEQNKYLAPYFISTNLLQTWTLLTPKNAPV